VTRSPEPPPTGGCKLPADKTGGAVGRDTGHGSPAGHTHGDRHPPRHGTNARPPHPCPSRPEIPRGLHPQISDPVRGNQLQTVTRDASSPRCRSASYAIADSARRVSGILDDKEARRLSRSVCRGYLVEKAAPIRARRRRGTD
jgi:hypothetical protein